MLIADALITKEYWEPVFFEIQKAFEKGNYTKMDGVDVFRMEIKHPKYSNYTTYVAATELETHFMVFGWVLLEKPFKGWKSWEIAQSYVFNGSRGQGYGRLLYDTIVIQEGLILASGSQQSKSARDFWRGLVKSDRYHIWAHDFSNKDVYEPVLYDSETDNIWCILPIYQKAKDYKPYLQDIRLIAIKKV